MMRDLNRLSKDSETIIKDTINDVVDMMIRDAREKAPRDMGRLIDSIDKENRDTGWTVIFFAGVDYAAFQEFGTGSRVNVPAELADVAQQFRGFKSGNFEEFLENIKGWCSRKGIPESAAYPIAVSILQRGLNPQPFFYPAYRENKDKIESLIRQKFDRWSTQINTSARR